MVEISEFPTLAANYIYTVGFSQKSSRNIPFSFQVLFVYVWPRGGGGGSNVLPLADQCKYFCTIPVRLT